MKELFSHQSSDNRNLMVISWLHQAPESIEFDWMRLRPRVPIPTDVVLPTDSCFVGRSHGAHQHVRNYFGRRVRY